MEGHVILDEGRHEVVAVIVAHLLIAQHRIGAGTTTKQLALGWREVRKGTMYSDSTQLRRTIHSVTSKW